MKLSQAKNILKASIDSQLNNIGEDKDSSRPIPYLIGGPGLGKTTIVKELSRELEIQCKVVSLAQYDAGELAGWLISDNDSMKRLRPDWMPKYGEGILFFDELPQAPVSNQNISAQIINERRIGEHKLPDGWAIVCAGNRLSDRAGTNNMPTHVKDRLMFLEIEADLEDFMKYGSERRFVPEIMAFLRFRPEFLHKFDRDADASPSPRSWERVHTILSQWKLDKTDEMEAINGQVGQSASADFHGYKRVFDRCPDIDQLINNPDTAMVPEEANIAFAICANLSSKMNKENGKNILRYLSRMDQQEYTAFTIKDAVNKNPELKNAPFLQEAFSDGGILKTLALFK